MDLATRLALDTLQLVFLLTVPGLALLLVLGTPPGTAIRMIVYGISTSILFLILTSLLLLQFGVFSMSVLLITAAIPAIFVVARWEKTWNSLMEIRLGSYTLIPCLLVGSSVLLLLLVLTPRWNFLVAPNMDAGNYELYGNHFWKEGSFYLDGRNLLDRGASPTWLASHNTWNIDIESGLGRPSYLPAYPILLGVVKSTFDSAVASPVVNALLASLSAMVMVLIGLQLVKARFVVVSIVAGLVLTPMFFYYGKQLMSEQLGLLGILLIVHALLESRGLTSDPDEEPSSTVATLGLSVGVSFGVLSRLDFLPVLILLVAGLLVLGFDAWSGRGRAMPISFFAGPAIAGFGAFAVIGALGASLYLRHATPDVIEEWVSPGVFMPVYGLLAGIAILLAGTLPTAMRRLERSVPRARIVSVGRVVGALATGVWVAFILWNLLIRPITSGSTTEIGDEDNLIRLFSVSSPYVLGLTLLLSPLALIFRRLERGVVVMLIAGLTLAVYSSRHSPPEVWWMRRYILYVIPLCLLVLAGVVGQARLRSAALRARTLPIVAGILIAIVALGVWNMRPLFAAEVNPDVPRRMAQLMGRIPPESLVVVVEGNVLVRGLANSYRSLTSQSVLVDVSLNDLEAATALAESDQEIVVLSPMPLSGNLIESLGLDDGTDQGTIERQWWNWLAEIEANPRPSAAFQYFVYRSSDGGEASG